MGPACSKVVDEPTWSVLGNRVSEMHVVMFQRQQSQKSMIRPGLEINHSYPSVQLSTDGALITFCLSRGNQLID